MRPLLSLLIAAALLAAIPVAAQADTVTKNAAGDTYVRSDLPTTNFEASSPDPLHVDGDPVRRTLLYFTSVPASGVTSAKLRVHVRFHTGEPFEVHASTCQGWSETTVTYNTAPPVGELLATYADDPLGYQEVAIPADKIVPSAAGGFCLQLVKTGVNWMTLSSRESANPPQLVLDTTPVADTTPPETTITSGPDDGAQITDTTPTFAFSANEPATFQCTLDSRVLFDCSSPYTLDPQGQGQHQFTVQATDAAGNVDPTPAGRLFTVVPESTSPVSTCSDAPLVSATPSTMGSILANNNRVRINAAPGTYSSLSKTGSSTACIVIKCTVSAKAGTFGYNPSGCLIANQSTFQNVKNLTVENFVIRAHGDGEYGFQHYDQANTGSNTRFASNVFDSSLGGTDHDISTKNRGRYFEVLDNWFLNCRRHCWEIGQNGNIKTRPSTTGTSIFRGNVAYSATGNIITQRYSLSLTVEDNTFKGAAGRAIMNWPYWAKYPFPDSGAEAACRTGSETGDLYVPGTTPCEGGQYVPLRTVVRNNTFTGKSDLLFISRGVIDDTVLLQGNTGITACSRQASMDYWTSGTAAAHINEQRINGLTTAPLLDSASDRSC